MIPILFDRGETAFTSNGLGRLADCLSCVVTEERNGIYECQFTYPVTGEMYAEIQEGRIVGVIHDDVHDIQPFDIYSRSAPLRGVVTFYAHHISYRLGNIILKPMSAASCAEAFNAIQNQTYTACPFAFWTDKATTGTWANEAPSAVKAILGGQAGSILDVYGKGEYEWDGWAVKLHANRGTDNGVAIRYGVNLTDITHDIDTSGAYTGAVPFWQDPEDGTVVTLDEGYVKVSVPQLVPWTDHNGDEIVDDQGRVIYANVENSAALLKLTAMDLSDAFEERPTQTQLRNEAMRTLTSSEAWIPDENIKVSFVDLAHTEEYKAVAALQRVRLCDRVSVYCGPLGVSAVSMQVIRVVFNVLTERYDEIELGKARSSFAQTVTADIEKQVEGKPSVSMMQKAINNATAQITGAKGGHILDIYDAEGKRQEMLIMDTEDVNTAVKVWRINLGGFGFSRNGYAGPYGLAITQDGAIVADFITAGTLIANIIKAGILSDASGKNFWNMETGEFSLAATTTVGGSTVDDIAEDKASAAESSAKTYASGQVSALDSSLNQQNVFNRLTNNGQTQGIYLKNGKLYVNATYIDTGQMIADLIHGGTLKIGGLNNENGRIDIISSDGSSTAGTIRSDGLTFYGRSYDIAIDTNSIYIYGKDHSSYGALYGASYNGNTKMVVNGGSQLTLTADGSRASYVWDIGEGKLASNLGNLEMSRGNMALTYGDIDMAAGDLTVRNGTKSRAIGTDQYDTRLLYCYETPSPMFGDIGEGTIGEDGICYVWLDPIFAQTIATDQYQVFLQRYGEGECYVKERRGSCFIVAGTPGLVFGWEIKAKQVDHDQLRLEVYGNKTRIPAQTYAEDAAQHIDSIRKERESA